MKNKYFAVIGFLSVIIFWCTYFMVSFGRDDYSFLTKAISELGSVDVPNKWIWNLFGYILPGFCLAVFGFGLYKNFEPKNTSSLALVALILTGVFMTISGIFPGDFDDKKSLTMLLHTAGSFGSYIFFLIGAFSIPSLMRKSVYWEKAIKTSLLLVWLTIVFGGWSFFFPKYPAVGQRLVFAFYFIWISYFSYRLYKKPPNEKALSK